MVRRGLESLLVGHRVRAAEVLDPRAVRRHRGGPDDFVARLVGRRITAARRRGKYLWLPVDDDDALLAHLGMSGQMLVQAATAPPDRHLRVLMTLSGGVQLRFCDQRLFGGLSLSEGGCQLPAEVAHIARDPARPGVRRRGVVRRPASAPHGDQAGPARPDAGVGHRQHLRRRGVVAGAAALRPAYRDAAPAGGGAAARRRPGRPGRGAAGGGARRSTRCTLTSTAAAATSTGPCRSTDAPARPALGAARRSVATPS